MFNFRMNGVVPPMVTPFKENGDLDVESLKTLVGYLKNEVDGLFITGSYGAGPMMTLEEREKVVETTINITQHKIPVIPMVGSTNTIESIKLAKHAEKAGADAVAAVGPYYFTHNAGDVISFYTDLVESVDIPVYLYNNPGFQGYEISLDTIKELKRRGLAGVKDATFNILTQATYQRVLVDENFDVALGTEAIFAPASVLGCKAFIPGLANAFPEINKQMFREAMSGDYLAAKETQFKINKMRDIMYLARSTQLAMYAMLEIRGIIKAYPRKPFVPATDKEVQDIRKALIDFKMI